VTLGDTVIEPQGRSRNRLLRAAVRAGRDRARDGRVTVKKVDEGVAWGSLHWQYLEDMAKITPHEATPLKLEQALFVKEHRARAGAESGRRAGGRRRRTGGADRLRTDRDMEYVHLKDHRGSGTEPVNVLSQYKYQDGLAYYESTRDTASHFFIDYLPKGTYVFEYSTRVSTGASTRPAWPRSSACTPRVQQPLGKHLTLLSAVIGFAIGGIAKVAIAVTTGVLVADLILLALYLVCSRSESLVHIEVFLIAWCLNPLAVIALIASPGVAVKNRKLALTLGISFSAAIPSILAGWLVIWSFGTNPITDPDEVFLYVTWIVIPAGVLAGLGILTLLVARAAVEKWEKVTGTEIEPIAQRGRESFSGEE
jgi:hypothetical protein